MPFTVESSTSSVPTTGRAARVARRPIIVAGVNTERVPHDGLEIRRTDIDWRVVAPDTLRIAVTVRNPTARMAATTLAEIRAAEFGAFATQRPLTHLVVPPLAPGESITLQADVPVSALAPRSIMDALDEWRRQRAGSAPSRSLDLRPAANPEFNLLSEAEHLRRYDKRARTNWAGNLHVHAGSAHAERHRAQGLVVRPGVRNLIQFHLGDGHADSYRFRLEGVAASWQAGLADLFGQELLPFAWGPDSDAGHQWIAVGSLAVMEFEVQPPQSAGPCAAALQVQRRSTGETAVIEFELQPAG